MHFKHGENILLLAVVLREKGEEERWRGTLFTQFYGKANIVVHFPSELQDEHSLRMATWNLQATEVQTRPNLYTSPLKWWGHKNVLLYYCLNVWVNILIFNDWPFSKYTLFYFIKDINCNLCKFHHFNFFLGFYNMKVLHSPSSAYTSEREVTVCIWRLLSVVSSPDWVTYVTMFYNNNMTG